MNDFVPMEVAKAVENLMHHISKFGFRESPMGLE